MLNFIIKFVFVTILFTLLISLLAVPFWLGTTGHPILAFLSFPFILTGLVTILGEY